MCEQYSITTNRQARLDYYVPTRDEATRRTVDPLELLTSDGHDYLDAWCHLAGARRLFRLDRMQAVELVDEPRQEHDLAPRDLSEGLFEPGPDNVVAVVHLEPHARWVADYYPVDTVEELGGGRLAATLRVDDPRWLVRLALRLAPSVTVVEPATMRSDLERTATAALSLYDDAHGRSGEHAASAQGGGVA